MMSFFTESLSLRLAVLLSAALWSSSAVAGIRGVEAKPVEPYVAIVAHPGLATAVGFLPDGKSVITASYDGTAKLWDVSNGRLIRTFEAEKATVTSIAISADGKRLATGGEGNRTIRVWDIATGDIISILEPNPHGVLGLSFLPDGKLVRASTDGVFVWNVDEEKIERELGQQVRTWAMAVTPDGRFAACSYRLDPNQIVILDVKSGRSIGAFDSGNQGRLNVELAISPAGDRVHLWVNEERRIGRSWAIVPDEKKFQATPVPSPPELRDAGTIVLHPDGRHALLSLGDATLFDITPGDGLWRPIHRFSPGRVQMMPYLNASAISPDGKTIALVKGPWRQLRDRLPDMGTLELYRVPTPAPIARPGPAAGSVSWDVIPVNVKAVERLVPLDRMHLRALPDRRNNAPAIRRVGEKLDLAVWQNMVMVMREPGLLEPFAHDSSESITDATYDGKHFWVGSKLGGLAIFDTAGKLLKKLGVDEGLGRHEAGLRLVAVRPGRVLAFGAGADAEGRPIIASRRKTGWVAFVDFEINAAGEPLIEIITLMTEDDLPAHWPKLPARLEDRSALNARWAIELPAKDGTRSALAGMDDVSALLKVNLDDHTLTAMSQTVGQPYSPLFSGQHRPPTVIGDWVYSHNSKFLNVSRLDAAKPVWTSLGLAFTDASVGSRSLFADGNRVLLAGTHWFEVDAAGGKTRHLGPGLQYDGMDATGVEYYQSAHFGLAAFSPIDGCIFRISTDPARPRSQRPTTLPPPSTPPTDYFVPNGTMWIISRGGEPMIVRDGVIMERTLVLTPYFAASMRRAELLGQLNDRLNEARYDGPLNLAFTKAQKDAASRLRYVDMPVPPAKAAEVKRLFGLLTQGEPAAREAAKEALLVLSAGHSRDIHAWQRSHVDKIRAFFTAEQWKTIDRSDPAFLEALNHYFPATK